MTKDQIITKLFWLVVYMLEDVGDMYYYMKTIIEFVDDDMKEYPSYEFTVKEIDRIYHKFDLHEEQFHDIDKKLKELAE